MNMKTPSYWPQHKLYFLATISLFPEKIKDFVLTEVFFKPFFAQDNYQVIELTLHDYQNEGFLKYEKLGNYEWKITEVDSGLATDAIIEYLDDWSADKLQLQSIKKPLKSSKQQVLLRKALANAYNDTREKELRLTLEDIFGEPNSDYFGTTFWELVLFMQFSNMPIAKITKIGYDRSESGLYPEGAQPYVDIAISDVDLLRSLELESKSSEPISEDEPKEKRYNGLVSNRDGTISYQGKVIPFTTQQNDVMRVFLYRPEEIRFYDDFTDPYANIFGSKPLKDKKETLGKLISATRKKLDKAVGQYCITSNHNQGWTLKIDLEP